MSLCGEVEVECVSFGHVVEEDELISRLIRRHGAEVNLLNGEEHLRTNLTHHTSLERNHLLLPPHHTPRHITRQIQLYQLNLTVEVIYMN